MKAGIIIPIYNKWKELTVPCLESIKKYTELKDIIIIVCDNASADVKPDKIKTAGANLFGSKFYYHRNEQNKGFAVACNQGAEIAQQLGCEFLFFLNNDTLVTENWLEPLLQGILKEGVGMVGPLLLYPDNTVQHCGVMYTLNGHLKHIYQYFPHNHPVVGKPKKFKAITGAAFLTRTSDFFHFGKFCEEFINGFEDVDLCYRYVNNGYHCKVIPSSVIYHLESQSPGRLNEDLTVHNREVFISRNKFILPDAHKLFEADGYLPSLTKEYYFYVSLPLEKRQKLYDAMTADFSDERCYAMLQEEPYWLDGYFLLFDSLYNKKLYGEAQNCCETAFKFGFIFDKLNERYLHSVKKTQTDAEYRRILQHVGNMQKERDSLANPNQLRLKVLVDEEWRKKLFLTRKNPIFLGEN